MQTTVPFKKKPFRLAAIVMPILITQVALYMITFFDILMTGRYDTYHLAGVTIGSSFWVPVYTGLAGILMGLTPIIAQLVGARRNDEVKYSVQQGLYVSIVLAGVVFLIIRYGVSPILESMPLEDEVRVVAANYLEAMSLGLFPLFAYTVLRCFFDALGATRVSMAIILLSAPLTIFTNYLLIYGNWGFPELGGVGAGYAAAITYWLIFFIAFGTAWKHSSFSQYRLFNKWGRPSFIRWKEILFIGVPIGIAIFVETSIFSAVTLLMSNYSTTVISAHQVALNFSSLLYMIPLSISMGVTILVGQAVGAGQFRDAKQYSFLAVGLAMAFSTLAITILLIFREQIAALYTTDVQIIGLASQFLIYAALFQLSDAVQAPVQGSLRGYKDVNMTFIMAIISFWVIGLPVGYLTATFTDLGPYGYWVGLIVGLTIGAITLSIRLLHIQKRHIKK
ncbi:MATE family efflux transporter [Sporosarcina koreensis]|uniref:Probable multidrug resistance protein NorM n=1 Tax=Sporosarcina koreensis TaxID=334735 RepID=A0ABW0TYF8_9BACL